MSVSTFSRSLSSPPRAERVRAAPSQAKGVVTVPMVRAPTSRATSAMTGAAPVPVPPPMPAATNTISAPFSSSSSSARLSSAARSPRVGSPPTPRPFVSFSPMRSRSSASEMASACASVFTATKVTPGMLACTMRLTALPPPPPTPTTLMSGSSSLSTASFIV